MKTATSIPTRTPKSISPETAQQGLTTQINELGKFIFHHTLRRNSSIISGTLHQPWTTHTASMAATALVHALARSDWQDSNHPERAAQQWAEIAAAHGYNPDRVFTIALSILRALGPIAGYIMRQAMPSVRILRERLSPHQDITGNILQQTVANRKALATFYTKPTVAFMAAHLAVPDSHQLLAAAGKDRRLNVLDPACGTGILLTAVADAITARLADHHEDTPTTTLTALDVLPLNTAITADNLAHLPQAVFTPNVLRLDYGHSPDQHQLPPLGSIDLLDPEAPQTRRLNEAGHNIGPRSQNIVIATPRSPASSRKTLAPPPQMTSNTTQTAPP